MRDLAVIALIKAYTFTVFNIDSRYDFYFRPPKILNLQ